MLGSFFAAAACWVFHSRLLDGFLACAWHG
jgi:hypothetical protein